MKVSNKMLFTAPIYWAILLGAIVVYAETNLNGPATLGQGGEYYRLTKDITASGTAFTITGDNIVLDLNGYTVMYNNSEAGPGIKVSGKNNAVKNGKIVQGSGKSGSSPGIYLSGSEHEVSYLAIKVNGIIAGSDQYAAGIDCHASLTKIHHNYIEHHGTTSNISYSPRCIRGDHRTTAGMQIYDNILEGCHQGISLGYLGLNSTDTPDKITRSYVYNNLIQHERTPGTKAPYCIALGKCWKVDIYGNTCISDNGRGIILDGLGFGVPTGTEYCNVYENRIDANYQTPAKGGEYPENHVIGIRDRYSSGNNANYDNIILVDNGVSDEVECVMVGSDAPDAKMVNLSYTGNTCINQHGGRAAWVYAVFDGATTTVSNNSYIADTFWLGDWDYYDGGGEAPAMSNNKKITPTSYTPGTPSGLSLRKFFDSYVLQWNLNTGESQTLEYKVYRDGSPLDISTRGGGFYVDVGVSGVHRYSVSAINLAGIEGQVSPSISTDYAGNGWWDDGEQIAPLAPTNLKIGK